MHHIWDSLFSNKGLINHYAIATLESALLAWKLLLFGLYNVYNSISNNMQS